MKIFIYYHITLINNWKDIVREQCTRIIFSGLYDDVYMIYCYAVDSNNSMQNECLNVLSSFGKKFILKDVTTSGDEWFTLQNLQYERSDDDLVLYIHTKGVTRFNTSTYKAFNRTFNAPSIYENVTQWRDLMEFFLIRHYKKCIQLLNDGHDTVGINFCTDPNHYSGNFWWCTGKYLKTLNYEKNMPEEWILHNTDTNCSLFQSPLRGYGHYFTGYNLCNVTDTDQTPLNIL